MQDKPAESIVLLNGEQPKKELSILSQKVETLKKKYSDLDEESKKFGIDTPERWKIEKELEKVAKQTKAAEKEVKQVTKANFDLKKVLDDLSGSSLKNLYKAQDELYKKMKDGSIKRGTKEWDDHIKKLQSVKAEIASVKSEVNENSKGFAKFGKNLGDIPGPVGMAAQAVKGFGTALKLLLLNPVGLALTLIVGILLLLKKAFLSTDSGATAFAGVLKGIGNVLDVLLDRTMSYFKMLGSIATFDMEGIKRNGQEAFGGIAESIRDASTAGYDYEQVMDSISDRESASLIRSAKLRAEIEKLKNQAKDATKPIEERIRLNNLAMQKEKELLAIEKGFLKEKNTAELNNLASLVNVQGMTITQKRKQVEEWLKLDDRTIEQYAKNNRRFKEFYDKNEDAFKALQKLKSDEFVKDSEFETETRRLQKEGLSFKAQILKEEHDKYKAQVAAKKALSKQQIEDAKKLEEEEKRLAKEISDNQLSDLEYALQMQKLKQQQRLAGVKLSIEQEQALQVEAATKTYNSEMDKLEILLRNKQITDEEFKKRGALKLQEMDTAIAVSDANFQEKTRLQKLENEANFLLDEIELNKNNLDRIHDLESIQREKKMAAELAVAGLTEAQIQLIKDKYRKQEEESDATLLYNKQKKILDWASSGEQVLGNLNNVATALGQRELAEYEKNNKGKIGFDEEFAKKKAQIQHDEAIRAQAMGVLGAIISTASAVIGAIAPPPIGAGPIAGIPLAIMAGISGAAQVAAILAAPVPNLWTGGFTDPGDKYKPAGIVHAGEFVANQDAVRSAPMRKVFNLVDHAQKTNTVARITNDDIIRSLSARSGYANGGFVSPAPTGSSHSVNVDMSAVVGTMQQTNAVNMALLAELQKGIKAKVSASGKDGVVEAVVQYNTIIKNARR